MTRRRLQPISADRPSGSRRGRGRAALAAGAAAAICFGVLAAPGPAEAAHSDHALHVGHPLAPGEQVSAAHGTGRLVVTRQGAVRLVRAHSRVELAAAAGSAKLARSTRLELHADGELAVRRSGHTEVASFQLTDHRVSRLTLSGSGRLVLWKGARKVTTTVLPAADTTPTTSTATAPTPAPAVTDAPSTPQVVDTPVPTAPTTDVATPAPVSTPTPTPVVVPDIPIVVTTPVTVPTDTPTVTAAPVASPTPDVAAPVASSAPVASTAPVPSTPVQASGVTGYSLTTQYVGGGTAVNIRSAASLSASIVAAPAPGTPITIVCQTTGDAVGTGAYAENRTWDRLGGAYTNAYVHDVLTTTPGGSRVSLSGGGYSAFSSGIPQCSDQGASPAPVAAPAPVSVGNAGNYPDDDATACGNQYDWCKNGGEFSARGFVYRNCTDYVAWRLNLKWADVNANGSGNAIDWRQGWINRGRTVSTTPKVGAVAWWGSTLSKWGHVGVVIAVNSDGTARIAQYNRTGTGRYSETTERAVAYLY